MVDKPLHLRTSEEIRISKNLKKQRKILAKRKRVQAEKELKKSKRAKSIGSDSSLKGDVATPENQRGRKKTKKASANKPQAKQSTGKDQDQ